MHRQPIDPAAISLPPTYQIDIIDHMPNPYDGPTALFAPAPAPTTD